MNRILRLTLINESAPTRINFNNVLWYSRPFKHQYYTEIKLIGEEYRLKVKETLEGGKVKYALSQYKGKVDENTLKDGIKEQEGGRRKS